jgi:CBS domain-containing protein
MGGSSMTLEVMTAKDVLEKKGPQVISIQPEQDLREALKKLTENSVGSLIVIDEKQCIVGILSERDILRANAEYFDQMSTLKIKDIMTQDVIIGLYDDSLDSIMGLMTKQRIRHLPILTDDGQLAGIVSIGDIVKAKANQAEIHVRHLTDYISGQYPG